jgi:regulator of cell morphogenesis and NO signaling
MKTKERNIIDVRRLNPREKHPEIFRMFDLLETNEELVILNDHDPKPLYYQLIWERGECFQWAYLENGPERWMVSIVKGKQLETDTVGEIVSADYRKAEVFKKYGIDFCCGGKKTLRDACQERGVNVDMLKGELSRVKDRTDLTLHTFSDWNAEFLADYILNVHHTYTKRVLPELKSYAYKVSAVHSEFHPELTTIRERIDALNDELLHHMMKEENILFPYIKELASSSAPAGKPHFGTVKNPIAVMEQEHDDAGMILKEIRGLSNNYSLPPEACASYTLLYKLLMEFESDLHLHIHLENNVLFPKAKELEKLREKSKQISEL